jgi:hypothetical protein
MSTYHIPSLVNGIALSLGHAMATDPQTAAACATVADWHVAATERLNQRIAELDNMKRSGLTPVYPSASWELDGQTGSVQHVTASGRLTVVASDEELWLFIEAGPARPESREWAGYFERVEGNLFRWVPATRRVWNEPLRYTMDVVTGCSSPADRVNCYWLPADNRDGYVTGMTGIEKPGRNVVGITVSSDGHIDVEWFDAHLAEEKPQRLSLIWEIDDEVFNGAIAAADKSGLLNRLAETVRAAVAQDNA